MNALKNHDRGRTGTRLLRRARRRNEGAAMLVIMLIIIVTTAAAAVSVQNTTSELRVAGRERMEIQARYAAEAALNSTISWIDQLGATNRFQTVWDAWGAAAPPEVEWFNGGHVINNNASRHMAGRTDMVSQGQIGMTIPPITDVGVADPTGSFGPAQSYIATNTIVHVTDCQLAPSSLVPGDPVNGGPSGIKRGRYYCVLTARGRLIIRGNNVGAGLSWTINGFNDARSFQERSGVAHDARAVILTPLVQVPG